MTASYRVVPSWRDYACLVCGESVDGCPLACQTWIDWGDGETEYSFPVCSMTCGHVWGQTTLDAVAGNKAALHALVDAAAGKELED